ncbi:class I SAM-dependent methyltransferase [Micromonospora sp. NPDC000207]|uniref:SAM-dependent methyltransferase n=1 Tax=Micromonospora sp. NPDC000207 TaxID=3154246 RepID=UPI003320435B
MSDAGHGGGVESIDPETARHWDALYAEKERQWSGRPNARLVEEVTGLPPGSALDLGCGEGGDAIWLARQGWRVTAVDVSATALDRSAAEADRAGVTDRIEFRRHDLTRTFPPGEFDLVSAQFLQSRLEFPREEVLRAAARAVAPGGRLVIVEHGEVPPQARQAPPDLVFPTPEETLAVLDLTPGEWVTERVDAPRRETTGPDGQPFTLVDHRVVVRRVRTG